MFGFISGFIAGMILYRHLKSLSSHYIYQADHKPWFILSKIELSDTQRPKIDSCLLSLGCLGLVIGALMVYTYILGTLNLALNNGFMHYI